MPVPHWFEFSGAVAQPQIVQSASIEQESRLAVDVDPPEDDTEPSKVDVDVSNEVRPPQPAPNSEQIARITLNKARANCMGLHQKPHSPYLQLGKQLTLVLSHGEMQGHVGGV